LESIILLSAPVFNENSAKKERLCAFNRRKYADAKNEMTLDCFILRSSSFFTNSDHPQSRVISVRSWYLTSFLFLTFYCFDLASSLFLPFFFSLHFSTMLIIFLFIVFLWKNFVSALSLSESFQVCFLLFFALSFLLSDYIISPDPSFCKSEIYTNFINPNYAKQRTCLQPIDARKKL